MIEAVNLTKNHASLHVREDKLTSKIGILKFGGIDSGWARHCGNYAELPSRERHGQ
jgi:hypothetical protein